MKTKINSLRMMIPAIVEFDDGHTTMVYLDQIKGKVIVTDTSDIVDMKDFTDAVEEYMVKSIKPIKTPSVPKDGFEKLDPESYMGDE